MSRLEVTVTYVSPAAEEVDWSILASGTDDIHAVCWAMKEFERAHVSGLQITGLEVRSMQVEES